MAETHEILESTNRKIEVKDVNGALADPTTMAITIWKPDGSIHVDAQVMTNDDTGVYHYWYTISDQVGTHNILYEATTGAYVSKKRDSFEAVAELN